MKIISLILTLMTTGTYGQILSQVEHIYVDNNGVKIHYVSLGEGPLVVMIHGFPTFGILGDIKCRGSPINFG